ncbi:hypothetical protein GCM10009104_06740 [Marinobacterium maritimum]|uniref:Poly(3-hydroxyalkanoate) polymerase subunit PhaE n=1 Tax=Marinobacterium maritimum TaxID=500162 RepID=A0ABP3T9I0_9GAMM
MSEQLLNMMRQWLEQLEQGQNSPHASRYWQELQSQLSQNASEGVSPLQADLLYRITRQSEHFRHFAADLLKLCDEQQSIAPEQLIDSFRQHLDQLSLDWVLSNWPLPEQLAATLALLTGQDSPLHAGLKQLNPLLQQLLGILEPQLQPSVLQQLRNNLNLLEAFERARERYLLQLGHINSEALVRLGHELAGSSISDLEQLHHLWFRCYEECYQQRLNQQDYQQAFGALCNAAMAMRQGWQQQLDLLYARCGLVTLSQYDELSRQHHELRRRVRMLERQQGSAPQGHPPHSKDSHDAN